MDVFEKTLVWALFGLIVGKRLLSAWNTRISLRDRAAAMRPRPIKKLVERGAGLP
jgi:hypothetical protein